MNKRLLLKYKITKRLGVDIFGIFFRKQKRRDYNLQKLTYICFLEQIQLDLFNLISLKLNKFKYTNLNYFLTLFKDESSLLKFINYKLFYNKLLDIFHNQKKIKNILLYKSIYYRTILFSKYNKKLLQNTILEKTIFSANKVFNNKVINTKLYSFGGYSFNSSISRTEFIQASTSYSNLLLYFQETGFFKQIGVVNSLDIKNEKLNLKKKKFNLNTIYSMDTLNINKQFTLDLIDDIDITYKKKIFISVSHHHFIKLWKIKYFYGALSKVQLKAICLNVYKKRGDVLIQFIIALESRIDTVIFRSGLVSSIYEARQLINHGKLLINNKKVTNRSIVLKGFDILSLNNECKEIIYNNTLNRLLIQNISMTPPTYLEINYKLCMIIFLHTILDLNEVPFSFNFQGTDLNNILYYYY